MAYWLAQLGWRLIAYPVEIVFNALIIWWLLNRLAPPRLVLEEMGEAGPSRLRRYRQFPLPRCFFCSVLLFGAALFAATPVIVCKLAGIPHFLDLLLFLALWFYMSRWVISTFFAGTRAHHGAIFLIYVAVSLVVETVMGWIK